MHTGALMSLDGGEKEKRFDSGMRPARQASTRLREPQDARRRRSSHGGGFPYARPARPCVFFFFFMPPRAVSASVQGTHRADYTPTARTKQYPCPVTCVGVLQIISRDAGVVVYARPCRLLLRPVSRSKGSIVGRRFLTCAVVLVSSRSRTALRAEEERLYHSYSFRSSGSLRRSRRDRDAGAIVVALTSCGSARWNTIIARNP